MRFGSVCSGIEAASVAWHPLGWEAAWLAEIEPFPSAVLKHHYPDVPNYGDMTALPDRIRSGEVDAPDLFCGGTPCQAFSVAGKRQSLADARGNLSLTFCDIADAIDESRSVRGLPATIVFWENVPGVLSTGDNAFGCFLAQLCGGDEPLYAPDGWPDAGCVSGPSRTAAWRVLDAQYFGLAQRRRRVFVVASAREGFDPAAVLFEFDGVRRDTAPSREAGQGTAAGVETGAAVSSGHGYWLDAGDRAATIRAQDSITKADTLITNAGGVFDVTAFHPTQDPISSTEVCHSLGANENATAAVVQPISIHPHCIGRAAESGPQGKEYLTDGTAYCMDSRGQPQAVVQPVTYDLFNVTAPVNRQSRTPGDPCHTLARANAEHAAVVQPYTLAIRGRGDSHNLEYRQDGTANALLTPNGGRGGIGVGAIAAPIAWDEELNASVDQAGTLLRGGAGGRHDGVLAPTLTACNDPSRSPQSSEITAQVAAVFEATAAVAFQIGPQSGEFTDVAPTLDCRAKNGPIQNQLGAGVMQAMQVRRLTPVECERLQGFPDNYTAIPWRGKDVDNCPDGPRYKALGNSWAVPVVRWIGKRIDSAIRSRT